MGSQPPAREPLGGALDAEIARLDGRISQLWQAVMLLCIGLSGIAALGGHRSLGMVSAIGSSLLLGWFTLYGALLRRGIGLRGMAIASTCLESAIPWGFLLVIAHTQGVAYALGSWVPPLLVAVLLLLATARLRPMAPLVIGVVGGLAFPALYFALLQSKLSAAEAARPLYQPTMQITRGIALAAGGTLGMVVARALRGAIRKAEGVARQKELFGKYRLLHPIAAGGMGSVHAALYCPEGGFERQVAVKRIHGHMALESHLVEAFRREAELCARLVHPNIVQVLDFGSVEGTYFLAMEHIDGMTLQELMTQAREARLMLPAQVVAHVAATAGSCASSIAISAPPTCSCRATAR
jgi:serine/threonine-protein kinase